MILSRHQPDSAQREAGFSLIELVIAVLVLAVGVLGFAGMTSYQVRQATFADLQTERSVALLSALEYVNGLPYDSVAAGNDSVGRYEVTWTVGTPFPASKVVYLVTKGPGLSSTGSSMPVFKADVADTFTYTVLEP